MFRPPSLPAAPCFAALALLAPLARPAAAFTPAEAKTPMTVSLVRSDAPGCGAGDRADASGCPRWLALTGLIVPGTPALLSAALARLGARNVPVLIDSPGGSVEAAEAMGRLIRARAMTVAVAGTGLDDCAPADRACAAAGRAGGRWAGERRGFVAGGVAACASACVLVLAAGAERSVGENSFVGVHQIIVRQTFTRVMNTFRVMRRMVHGRPVEVSRTLVETRPVSSRQVVKPASDTMYSAVDRYLLGLGVAESIMPLMRATPPSGIHWMTRPELAQTRIATDTADPRTLVERSATPPELRRPSAMAVATARLGPAPRAAGIVNWSVARAGAPGEHDDHGGSAGAPVLAAAVEIPALHLRGTLALRRDEAPGGAGGFVAAVDFGDPAAIGPGQTWTLGAPTLCRSGRCLSYFAPAAEADDGHGRREFRVKAAWTDGFLALLAEGGDVTIPLKAGDGAEGWVSLALTDGTRATVQGWEHLCCGLAPAEAPPSAGAVADTGADTGANTGANTGAGTAPGRPAPEEEAATASWTVEREGILPPQPGATYLTGSVAVPPVGLALSLRAGLAQPVGSGFVNLTVEATADAARFGPLTDVAVETVESVDGRAALLPTVASRRGSLVDVLLRAGAPMPPEPKLALVLTDGQGRRIRVALRLPDGLARLLAFAARRVS